jgi:peptidoglycan/LPS O-acetylase OafA/YrhL
MYRSDIDGLRALAVLAVLVFHADPTLLRGGFAGVDVFFVISGYLITGIVSRECEARRFSFARFYARRARRLFPALLIVLVTTLLLGWLILLPDEFRTLGADTTAGAAFSSNLLQYEDITVYFGIASRPLLHLWSLGVEEQFYFLWPVLIYATLSVGGRRFLYVAAAATAASFLANVAVVSFDPQGAFFLPWNRLWELSLGGILATLEQHPWQPPAAVVNLGKTPAVGWLLSHRRTIYWTCGAALLLASFLLIRGTWEVPGFWALAPSIGAAAVIVAGPQAWFNRWVLSLRPIVCIGLISYPLYLWHWPLLCFARLIEPNASRILMGTVLLVALLLSVATYLYIELPLRRSPASRPMVANLCTALLCCGLVGYLISIRYLPGRPIPHEVQQLTLPRMEDWLSARQEDWSVIPGRYVEVGQSTTKTLFIGDSFMEQYYPRIERVEADFPRSANTAVFAVRSACSFPYEFSWEFGRGACKRHIQKALEYANRDDVNTVVLASAWPSYFMTSRQGAAVLNPKALPALKRFRQVVANLRRRNKHVFIVLVGPIDDALDPRSKIQRTVFPPGFRVIDIPPLAKADLEKRSNEIESLLRRIADEEGAIIIDPMEDLCKADTCPAFTPSGEAMYHDGGHLRPSYVRTHARFMDETVLRPPLHAASPVFR